MATVQILAFITLDGYLARRSTFPDLWEHPEKYGITRLREAALSCLGPDVSFMSLTEWKQGHSGVYLAEAALETLPFTDSLLRFDMADELVLYVLPRFQGEGFRLFEGSRIFLMGAGRDAEFRQGCLLPALQTGRRRVTAVSPPGCP